jgi:uncharacterized protein YeaO (DUF488 family)
MLPICKDNLSIDTITDRWSREIQPSSSREELVDFLEAAWWRSGLQTGTSLTPLVLLKRMFTSTRAGDLTGLVFVTQELQGIELADGGLLFYVHELESLRIPVPSNDPETWTVASCAPAFEALAQKPSRKHYKDRTIQFLMMEVYRDQFVRLLKAYGLDLPKFWRPAISKTPQLKEETHTLKDGKAFLKETPPADSYVRKRGPTPKKFNQTKEAMRRDIQEGKQTPDSLRDMLEKNLIEIYGFSRDTVRKARAEVLSGIVEKSNPDK